jgi:Rrf2 family protein
MKIKQSNSYALHAMMYMVRHITQLPVTVHAISKAEKIPYRQLMNLFQILDKAGIVKNADTGQPGYVFARPPAEISLLELFTLIEGGPIFQECFMNHCDCKATPDNCKIYASWKQSMASVVKKLSEITLENAAWGHPEHYS